jgi:hypothetical protein
MANSNTDLTVPTLHLNGSGWNNLYRDYTDALEALRTALQKLPVPHGRDYYVQGDDAYTEARRQYDAQCEKIMAVQDELTAILTKIHEQHRE